MPGYTEPLEPEKTPEKKDLSAQTKNIKVDTERPSWS